MRKGSSDCLFCLLLMIVFEFIFLLKNLMTPKHLCKIWIDNNLKMLYNIKCIIMRKYLERDGQIIEKRHFKVY